MKDKSTALTTEVTESTEKKHKMEIELNGISMGRVVMDGMEIQGSITRLRIDAKAGCVPVVELSMMPLTIKAAINDAVVNRK